MSEKPLPPILGDQQRRLVGAALTSVSIIALALSALLVFVILREATLLFRDVIWPLAVAGILAMLLRPVAGIFQEKCKLGRVPSILLLYLLVVMACGVLAAFVIPVIVSQLMELSRFDGNFFTDIYARLKAEYPQLIVHVREYISEEDLNKWGEQAMISLHNMLEAGLPAIKQAGVALSTLLTWATGAAIVPIYLFYFLESNRNYLNDTKEQLSFLNPSLREDIVFLTKEFISILVAFFRGQIVIGLIMGILLAVGFTLIGLKFGIALGLTIGLLNIIPYFGTIIGLGCALPIAFFQVPDGGPLLLGLAILVFALVQVLEGYVLTPKIMGGQTGLHPMAIIVAIFFWGAALDGILGMVLAIPLTAFFIVAWRLAKKKYLPMLTGHGKDQMQEQSA